jgi:integrase
LDWPDVIKAREAARLNASDIQTYQDYVILCLYSYVAPVRLDYTPVRVVEEKETDGKSNELLVLPSGYVICLREYKTARRYKEQRIPVPKELAAILKDWLEINQSGYLLINSSGGPMDEKALGARITAILKRHTGKAASLNIIRHSFASWVRRKEKPLKDMKAVAAGMLHSPAMNQLYRKLA